MGRWPPDQGIRRRGEFPDCYPLKVHVSVDGERDRSDAVIVLVVVAVAVAVAVVGVVLCVGVALFEHLMPILQTRNRGSA